jgi:hypothetical protein
VEASYLQTAIDLQTGAYLATRRAPWARGVDRGDPVEGAPGTDGKGSFVVS